MKLLNLLKKKPFYNNLHFFLISSILLMLGLKYYFILIFLLIYLIFIFKKTKLIIPISLLSLIIISHVSILKIIRDTNKKEIYKGYILDVIDSNTYIFKSDLVKLRLTDYNHNNKPGDNLYLEVELKDSIKQYENDFDYEEYLYSKGISYYGKVIKKEYIKSGFSIYSLKYMYTNYLKNNLSENSYNYVMSLVFGNNNLESNIKDSYSILGLSHILAISGLHILFLFIILSLIILKLFHIYKPTIPLLIISIYVLLIGTPISSLRALLFLIFLALNKKGDIYYSKLDILSLSFILIILFNPYSFYMVGFILSFLVSFILIYTNDLIKEENKILRLIKTYLLIYFITLPFVIKITGVISIFSIITSPFLSTILGFVLVPISYILSIWPILDIFLKYIFIFINNYLEALSNLLPLIHIKQFNIYMMLLYYIIYTLIIYNVAKKKSYIYHFVLGIYLSIIILFKYINPIAEVNFISVGQGDSSLIRLPYNQGIVLVDAYNSFSYLKSEGIDRIDYFIITHSDIDHLGDYKEILDYFNVKMVIYPKFDTKFSELLANYKNIKSISSDTKISLNNTELDILGPIKDYGLTNNNSIVFKIKIFDKSFLFTGDIEKEAELDLCNKYNNKLDSDILKVAHHGSDTSSIDRFINLVSPSYSIISAGLNNKYDFPNEEILKRLEKKSKVYVTKDRGNIRFLLFNNHMWINTFR